MKRSRLTPKKILLTIMIAIVFYLSLYLFAHLMVGLDVEKEEVLPVQQRWQIIDCYKEEGIDWRLYVKLKYLGENRATSVWVRTITKDNGGTDWYETQYLQDFSKGQTQTFTASNRGNYAYSFRIDIHWDSGNSTDLSTEFVVVP